MSFRPAGRWPHQPVILEVNTWVWLDELSRALGRRITLATVPPDAWYRLLTRGIDAVWLMGVWTRSPAGAVIARSEPGVHAELQAALPDLSDDDVVGSPYSIRGYTVDQRLGGDEGLAAARSVLAGAGVRLLVDYVPNHVARDHAWVTNHPEYLVRATHDDARAAPHDFVAIGDTVVALGRDPYFPPWTDVVQLNAFSQPLRAATAATLIAIGDRADGVRCDMAMLLLNDIFAQTWSRFVGPAPDDEFWPAIIREVRRAHPDFLFVAEAYWDREADLLEQGFDFCYDKRLYDRLVARDAAGLRRHLTADVGTQRRMVRFIENHDEPRAATSLPGPAQRAAAVAVTTLPGAVLLYEGQFDGRTQRPPVQLGRRPDEAVDADLRAFYESLLAQLADLGLRDGTWTLLAVDGVSADTTAEGLCAWSWETDDHRCVIVVNVGDVRGDGRVRLPWPDLRGRTLVFAELLDDSEYHHEGDEVSDLGLFVRLAPAAFHALVLR